MLFKTIECLQTLKLPSYDELLVQLRNADWKRKLQGCFCGLREDPWCLANSCQHVVVQHAVKVSPHTPPCPSILCSPRVCPPKQHTTAQPAFVKPILLALLSCHVGMASLAWHAVPLTEAYQTHNCGHNKRSLGPAVLKRHGRLWADLRLSRASHVRTTKATVQLLILYLCHVHVCHMPGTLQS